MIVKIKLIFELVQLLVSAYKFITGALSEAKFRKAVRKRKANYDAFIKGTRADRLKILKKENDEN